MTAAAADATGPGKVVVLGSGETAPTMVKVHRQLFAGAGSGSLLLLDTPYGFQENADDISAKAQRYFRDSVGTEVDVLSWRRAPGPGLDRERALTALRAARWVFAGPGSPTYALRQWSDSAVPALICDVARRGGAVVFASAAALTLGSHTIPVYEIYKAGEPEAWRPGLDLVKDLTGLAAVVIPHYDNAEGGHHDTRFCYLGERRLAQMERELPAEAFVLGVDEHTGCVLDLAARTATIVGNGVLTLRRAGASRVFPSGSVLTFDEMADPDSGPDTGAGHGPDSLAAADGPRPAPARAPAPDSPGDGSPTGVPTSLRGAADAQETAFAAALERRDVDGCTAAVLALEQALTDWSSDTLASDEGDHARDVLRSMIVRLGGLAEAGGRDPRELVAPFVETLLQLRAHARTAKDFATSDTVRDALAGAGVEVRDTPDGAQWLLQQG